MSQLALAAFVFVAMHIFPALAIRTTIIRRIGDPAYMALFSLASFLGLAWMIHAYANAPASEPLWVTGPVVRIATAAVMLLVFIMAVQATTSANPAAIKGGDALKKRKRWNNIFAVTRHPLMWAIALWAGLHLLNRPDATSALFFGSLGFLAIAGSLRQDLRKREEFGKDWNAYAAQTSFIPFAGLISGKSRINLRELGGWPLAIAVALWAALLFFHGPLFGAYPLAF